VRIVGLILLAMLAAGIVEGASWPIDHHAYRVAPTPGSVAHCDLCGKRKVIVKHHEHHGLLCKSCTADVLNEEALRLFASQK